MKNEKIEQNTNNAPIFVRRMQPEKGTELYEVFGGRKGQTKQECNGAVLVQYCICSYVYICVCVCVCVCALTTSVCAGLTNRPGSFFERTSGGHAAVSVLRMRFYQGCQLQYFLNIL